MNDYEKALENLNKSVLELRRHKELKEKSQDLFDEWTKTLKLATKMICQITEQIDYDWKIPEKYSDYQKIRDIYDSFFELHSKVADLDRRNEERTAQIDRLETDLKNLDKAKRAQIDQLETDLRRLDEERTAQINRLETDLKRLDKERTVQVRKLEIENNKLESQVSEKTKHICKLLAETSSPDNITSDKTSDYTFERHLVPFLHENISSWKNSFPCAGSTQKEIDNFKEYLRLAFLRGADERTNELKDALVERFGKFIEEYDKFVDAIYDPQRGERFFDKCGLYLLDLNEEARGKLFQEDDSYLNLVTIGGRPVKYYDDKRTIVVCKGETNYRHTEEFDVLFPGFCARCRNSDDIWLLIPPYIYQRPDDKPVQIERPTDYNC